MAETIIDLLKNSSYVEKMDALINAVKASSSSGDMLKSTYDPTGSVATAGGIPDYVDPPGGKIDTIKVNGTAQVISDKTVNITVPTKTSDITNDSGYLTSAPVASVNSKTGVVVLTANDVGAATTSDIHTAINRTNAVNVANSNYTTYMARGEALFSSETTPTVNGTIAWQYE